MTTTLPAREASEEWSSGEVRVLGVPDADAVRSVLDQDAVASCMVAARVEVRGVEPAAIGGEIWSAGQVAESLCFVGPMIIPLRGGPTDTRLFAERAVAERWVSPSLVGHADRVLGMWSHLEAQWGPAREVRACQPLMAMHGPPVYAIDSAVRLVRPDELDEYLDASVQMFIGEMGVDPCSGDGGRGYRRRVAALIEAGRAWARFEDGRVVFKADIGSQSSRVSQIQGVWVDPEFRGRGLGTAGVAAVAVAVQRAGRLPSLYVNSYNDAARASYVKAGFSRVGTFATVLVS